MSLKDKLIKLLGGYTQLEFDLKSQEIEFLRTQVDRQLEIQEALTALQESISREQVPVSNPVKPAPVIKSREPWMTMKNRLETEDYQRSRQGVK